MSIRKKLAAAFTAGAMALGMAGALPQTALEAEAAVSYPVQLFRLGMADTDNNVTASGSSLAPAEMTGEASEKWSVNYVSSGVFEIVSSSTGQILTANGTGVSLAADTDGANQRWKIEGVEKDFDGYYLYYKITSNADSSKALTYTEGSGFSLKSYSGETYQKYKLNLDGLEGFAADCMTSSGEKAGTIGGLLGEVVYVSTADDLEKQLNTVGAQTIVITSDIDMQKKGNTRIRDNKTIVGCYGSHTIYDSQFRTNDAYGAENDSPSDNIIFRNLKMVAKNTPNRILINIWSSRQIWIDHIYFESQLSYDRTGNGQDEVGKFIWINTPYESYRDAKDRLRSPDYVTISYCHLKNRYWTVAYGTQNDEITRDRTTLLYNWWDQNVRRCPQLGNGSAHVYNNYYSAYGDGSNGSATTGIIGGDGSEMLSQNNMFNGYTVGQALTMGGDANKNPARDDGSYLSKALNGTSSAINFQSKNTSKWQPGTSNYGYALLDAYNTKGTDTKAFCTKYAGDQTSASNMKYITDSDLIGWATTVYPCPFLRHVELKTKAGAVFDTSLEYLIQNVNSGLYLEVGDASPSSGTNVQQGSNRALDVWKLADAGDGYYYIYSTAGNGSLCIDLPYGSTDNGTSIGLWSNDESDARKFKFVPNGDGTFTITTKCTSDASCFGVMSDSKEDGADVIQWPSTGNDSQKWYVNFSGELFSEVKVLDSEHYSGWSLRKGLKAGDTVFGDRTAEACAVSQLSSQVAGAETVLTACDAKAVESDLAELTAGRDIIAYAAFDSRVTTPGAWLSGWTKTSLTIQTSNSVTFELYEKELSAGEKVKIGANGQSYQCMSYFVLAVEKPVVTTATTAPATTTAAPATTTVTEPVTAEISTTTAAPATTPLQPTEGEGTTSKPGDANCDDFVNLNDAVAILQHVANEKKYGLTEEGLANADVYDPGDGVTGMDALAIQMLDAELIESLPYYSK
ncbi:MAG: RICIN domain-containing protein [Ruminococcus sp.]|nr:RICIN domain-containing protein [Ruminococcus sp.]